MKKRLLASTTVLLLAALFMLTGCGDGNDAGSANELPTIPTMQVETIPTPAPTATPTATPDFHVGPEAQPDRSTSNDDPYGLNGVWASSGFSFRVGYVELAFASKNVEISLYYRSGGWGSWPTFLGEQENWDFVFRGNNGTRLATTGTFSVYGNEMEIIFADGTVFISEVNNSTNSLEIAPLNTGYTGTTTFFMRQYSGYETAPINIPALGVTYDESVPPGTGAVYNPFLLATPQHLVWMYYYNLENAHFRMVSDIVVPEATADLIRIFNANWYFDGVFDGGGHTIIIDVNTSPHMRKRIGGLFSTVSEYGIIRNVVIDGLIYAPESSEVGGLVGRNYGLIENVIVYADVIGASDVGGIAGMNRGVICTVRVYGDITGSSTFVGGVAGTNSRRIFTSHSSGNVTGFSVVGGMVGHQFRNGSTVNSKATGSVYATIGSQAHNAGQLIGLDQQSRRPIN